MADFGVFIGKKVYERLRLFYSNDSCHIPNYWNIVVTSFMLVSVLSDCQCNSVIRNVFCSFNKCSICNYSI